MGHLDEFFDQQLELIKRLIDDLSFDQLLELIKRLIDQRSCQVFAPKNYALIIIGEFHGKVKKQKHFNKQFSRLNTE